MATSHAFIDTNILVYAHDADADQKHQIAQELVKDLWKAPYPPSISVQVLQELYVSLHKKGAKVSDCKKIVNLYYDWEVINNDLSILILGIEFRERFKISLWDSLIIAAAHKAKADIVYSEDLANGQKFEKVTIVNPFFRQ